jgi:hypothetical protein
LEAGSATWCIFDDYFVSEDDPTHKLSDAEKKAGVKPRQRQATRARAWFVRHPDPVTGMIFPAKPRVAPTMMPKLLEKFPGGYFEPTPTSGIDEYLIAVESLAQEASTKTDEWKKKVDLAREAAAKVGGTDAPKADPSLVKATMTGSAK